MSERAKAEVGEGRGAVRPPARDLPKQLTFDLPLDPRFGREDFFVSASNEAAYAMIERWPDWPDPVLRLEGPPGSGKSHLASIWATRAHAWTVDAFEVSAARVPHLVSGGALVIEDADAPERDEAALFHLLNLARERGVPVLVTAARPLDTWGLRTADLLSRLRLSPLVRLEAADEALLRAVLVKLFLDRQLIVDIGVIDTLVTRIERSLRGAGEAVLKLDREALSRGRRITRALAASVLGAAEDERE